MKIVYFVQPLAITFNKDDDDDDDDQFTFFNSL